MTTVTMPRFTDYEDGKDLAIDVVDACAKAGLSPALVKRVERIDPYDHDGPSDYLLAVRLVLEDHDVEVVEPTLPPTERRITGFQVEVDPSQAGDAQLQFTLRHDLTKPALTGGQSDPSDA